MVVIMLTWVSSCWHSFHHAGMVAIMPGRFSKCQNGLHCCPGWLHVGKFISVLIIVVLLSILTCHCHHYGCLFFYLICCGCLQTDFFSSKVILLPWLSSCRHGCHHAGIFVILLAWLSSCRHVCHHACMVVIMLAWISSCMHGCQHVGMVFITQAGFS